MFQSIWDSYGVLLWGGGILFLCFWLRSQEPIAGLQQIILGTAWLASLYGLLQYFKVEWIWPQLLNPYAGRSVSTFGNPNFMSSYLVAILPVAIADYVFKVTGLSRISLFWVITASVGALIATLTRSSWAGAAAAVAVAALGAWPAVSRDVWTKIRKPALALAAVLVLMVISWPKSSSAAYSQTVFGRLTEVKQVAQGTYGAVTQRFLIWLCAWGMVEDHPLIGKGWGTFELFYPYYQGAQLDKKVFRNVRTHANNAHNEVLEYWAQVGAAGLGVVLLLWVAFFRAGGLVAKRLPLPWKALAWGYLGGVAGVLVDNLLNVSVHFAVPAFIFWWWVGSVWVLEPSSLEVKRFTLEPLWRRGILGAAALALLGFSVRSALLWAEEIHFFEGFKLSKAGVDLARAQLVLEKAYRYHPLDVNNSYELANVYARRGLREKALGMYQRALDANAGYDEIFFNRATMHMQMGNDAQAIQNYRTALAINPLSREAVNALSGIYIKDISKHGEEAVALYRRALAVYPEDKDLWNNLGYLEVQRQRWEGAREAYRKALEIDPNFDLARRNLAVVELNVRKRSANKASAPKP